MNFIKPTSAKATIDDITYTMYDDGNIHAISVRDEEVRGNFCNLNRLPQHVSDELFRVIQLNGMNIELFI